MSPSPRVITRPYRSDDHAYVTSTFLRSFVESRPRILGWELPARVIYEGEGDALGRLIDIGPADIVVAVAAEDDSAILGYSIQHEDCLDYVYVARECRRGGLAKELIAQAAITSLHGLSWYSHLTPDGQRLLRHLPSLRFNPYLFWMA